LLLPDKDGGAATGLLTGSWPNSATSCARQQRMQSTPTSHSGHCFDTAANSAAIRHAESDCRSARAQAKAAAAVAA
jgi:hypothetical protein